MGIYRKGSPALRPPAARKCGRDYPGPCSARFQELLPGGLGRRETAHVLLFPPCRSPGPPDSAVFKLFFSRDDNVPDIDTTCLILGSLITLGELFGLPPESYGHDTAQSEALLSLMEQHVFGKGRYGRKSLSYDNGILPGDDGVMTWVFDDHNELDPTSNINILNWLVLIPSIHPELSADRLAALAQGIFRFLHNHVRDGSFLDQRFQSYYPLGPTYLFWGRFLRNFRTLPPETRRQWDPGGAVEAIDAHLLARGEEIILRGMLETNPFDRLLAAPFLYERGTQWQELSSWLNTDQRQMDHFRKHHYEIFHLRYPSKIFCAPLRIPQAAALELSILVDKLPPS